MPLAPVLFEIDVANLQLQNVPAYREISKFQPVVRDLALVVKDAISGQDLTDIFEKERRENPLCSIVQAIVLFDEYKGKGLESDEKSLAFRFTLQDTQRTLQDEAVDAAMNAFVAASRSRLGARLRA